VSVHGLQVVPMYLSDRPDLLQELNLSLQQVLHTPVNMRKPWFDPEISFEPSRGQYNSTTLLRLLLDDPSDSTSRTLGVTSADLFAPVLTYVFGEAQLDGRVAVVSIHRLRPEAYGLPKNEVLLFERLLKESVHELGHTLGLIHCLDGSCVMHASTYVEEIDLKTAEFCANCERALAASA
jgi:archaemetzincin